MKYNKIIIKISGECLGGEYEEDFKEKIKFNSSNSIHNENIINNIVKNIKGLKKENIKIAIVVGGGNIYRGSRSHLKIPRVIGDHVGMLATFINGIVLAQYLKQNKIDTLHVPTFTSYPIAEQYTYEDYKKNFDQGKVLVFSGGTGNPFYSTDSAVSLRAAELECDLIMKATKVDGVYDKDPYKHKNSKKYDFLKYDEVINNSLNVMDLSSILMAKEKKMAIKVFSIKSNFNEILKGYGKFTLIN